VHQSGDEVSDENATKTKKGDTTMFTKPVLTAAVILGTASLALATEQDPNLANRYATFNGGAAVQTQVLRSAPVALQTRNVALGGSQAAFVKTYDREGASVDGGTGR
jgi:hypothetical protein